MADRFFLDRPVCCSVGWSSCSRWSVFYFKKLLRLLAKLVVIIALHLNSFHLYAIRVRVVTTLNYRVKWEMCTSC